MTKAESARANGRKGGRPQGSKAQNTLEKAAARQRVRELVCAELDPLVEAQIQTALGVRHFVVREKDGKFKRVTNPATITRILNAPNGRYEYYDIWTRDPSTQAFKDLMDRALGKPTEHVDMTVSDDAARIRILHAGRERNARAEQADQAKVLARGSRSHRREMQR